MSKAEEAIIYYNYAIDDFGAAISTGDSDAEQSAKRKILQNALSNISISLELNPRYYNALYLNGEILVEMDRSREAVDAFDQAINVDPTFDAYLARGDALFDLRRFRDAVESYKKAKELEPNNNLLMNNMAKALYNSGDYQNSVAYYKEAIRITDKPLYNYGLGLAYYAFDKKDEALTYLKNALRLNENAGNEDALLQKEIDNANRIIAELNSTT
jgi:tetratricopeptide (TPR) repeat protein